MIRIRSGDTVTELAWTGENIPAARLLAQAGLYPDYPCGGQGRCGKCRVLAHGDLSPAAPEELAQLPPRELARGMRLACLARICGPDAELTLPREDGLLVETGGSLHRLEWDPWAAALGICVDIGTTTVAAYLWDLDRRCRLGVASCKNPQERFGADVVSRLDASLAGQGDALRACIVRCLSDLAYQLCRQAGRPVSDVGGAVITGNTAMLYLLRGCDVRDIALAPFQARHLFGESVPARELGLDWGADCQVYLPPACRPTWARTSPAACWPAIFSTPAAPPCWRTWAPMARWPFCRTEPSTAAPRRRVPPLRAWASPAAAPPSPAPLTP